MRDKLIASGLFLVILSSPASSEDLGVELKKQIAEAEKTKVENKLKSFSDASKRIYDEGVGYLEQLKATNKDLKNLDSESLSAGATKLQITKELEDSKKITKWLESRISAGELRQKAVTALQKSQLTQRTLLERKVELSQVLMAITSKQRELFAVENYTEEEWKKLYLEHTTIEEKIGPKGKTEPMSAEKKSADFRLQHAKKISDDLKSEELKRDDLKKKIDELAKKSVTEVEDANLAVTSSDTAAAAALRNHQNLKTLEKSDKLEKPIALDSNNTKKVE